MAGGKGRKGGAQAGPCGPAGELCKLVTVAVCPVRTFDQSGNTADLAAKTSDPCLLHSPCSSATSLSSKISNGLTGAPTPPG